MNFNLWILNHYAIPSDLPGATRHYDLGRELIRRGHNVVIIASSFHYYMRTETRLKPGEKWKVENINGIKFVWLRTSHYQRNDWRRIWNMVAFMLRAWRLGRKLPKLVPETGKPDVVIGSSPHLLTPLAAYWVARHHRVPFLMEVRDLWPQTFIDMGELSARHPVVKALQVLEKFVYHRAERIITVLPLAHEYITTLGIPREKIIWIPNGVDPLRFKDFEFPRSASNERFKVMYLGAHGQANALDVLIQAAKAVQARGFSEIQFILVGDGPEKPRLVSLAQDLGLRNVEFRPPVPKNEVPRILNEADAFILNLEKAAVFTYGISSNKLFDYMIAARPVIFAVDAPNNPVKEARCGLTVPPRDPNALAQAIIKLYQMPKKEREAMGQRGRAYVEEHHDIRKLAQRLEQTLTEVVMKK